MKASLFFLSLIFLFGCKNDKGKNDRYDEKSTAQEQREDARQNDKKEPLFYIAFKDDKDGPVYLTDSDEDIDRLIVDLRPLGVEVALLERDYWKDQRCRKMSARKCAAGDCVIGNCVQTEVGGWKVCRCQ